MLGFDLHKLFILLVSLVLATAVGAETKPQGPEPGCSIRWCFVVPLRT